jgi:hypothetical protein
MLLDREALSDSEDSNDLVLCYLVLRYLVLRYLVLRYLVLRYLVAFGPAGVRGFQAWSG